MWKASDKPARINSGRVCELARQIRADEPTTEWDIAQVQCSVRYREEGIGAGAMDRGGERFETLAIRITLPTGLRTLCQYQARDYRVDRSG